MGLRFGTCCANVVAALQGNEDAARAQLGTVEAVLYEYNYNFDDLSSGMIQARFNAIVNRSAIAGTATFKMYVGATAVLSPAGAVLVATITTTSATDEKQTNLGSSFMNFSGQQLVQITGFHSAAGGTANIRGMSFTIG